MYVYIYTYYIDNNLNRGHEGHSTFSGFRGFSLPTSGSDLKVLESLLDEEIEYPQVGWDDGTCQPSMKLNCKMMTELQFCCFLLLFPRVVIVVHSS